MNARAALAASFGLAGLVVFAAGCGDPSGSPVGFGDSTPTGGAYLGLDVQPIAPGDTSRVVLLANVLDATPADGFRLYGNPNGAGYRAVSDYIASPQVAFTTGYEAFLLSALPFDPSVPTEFVAHGARGGIESNVSTVSEHASTPASTALDLARRAEIALVRPFNQALVDTVPRLSWVPVPGATRYLVRIFFDDVNLQYMALVSDSAHVVQSQPAVIFHNVPLRANLFFTWSVTAYDAGNRIIGVTTETRGFETRRF